MADILDIKHKKKRNSLFTWRFTLALFLLLVLSLTLLPFILISFLIVLVSPKKALTRWTEAIDISHTAFMDYLKFIEKGEY